jgi:flagellar secretion chaperone FliS
MANPYTAYLETKVLTASPLQLVHLAYESAMQAVSEARAHLAERNIHARVRSITRAAQILTELQASLDFEQGAELSTRLAALYDYMQRRLNYANLQQADEPLAEVYKLLETVDEAWKELASSEAVTPDPSPSPWTATDTPVYSRPVYSL